LCSLIAGYISVKCYSFAKTWAVPLISAWGGLILGLILIKLTPIKNATAILSFGIFSSAFGAWVGKKLNLMVRACSTAFFGAYLIIKGINKYCHYLPENLWTSKTFESGEQEYISLLFLAGYVAIAV